LRTVFLRVLDTDDKAATLREAIRNPQVFLGSRRFDVDGLSFSAVPRSPFAYWVSDSLRALFGFLPSFEAKQRTVKQGLATADDFRFLRAWWEVVPAHKRSKIRLVWLFKRWRILTLLCGYLLGY
jgi:hypothetical protein